ncbi:dUTP diphosphatase [bacterium]|jgi:dUTP pyrophosphatase|nr:dUTP diphosphatase [bacterium]
MSGCEVVRIPITRMPHAPENLPEYASAGAAGADIRLAGSSVIVSPGERMLLPTGFSIAIPLGFEGQVRLRSGFARRTGLFMPNAPGTIDSDYRGELLVLVMNASRESVKIESGERFAQLVICPVARAEWNEVGRLPETERGSGGFGSTGHA